jgi:hypothetical protein
MMNTTDGLLDILEIAMGTCGKQAGTCEGCRNISNCKNLWSRACEQSFIQALTAHQLQDYIEEFNNFLKNRRNNCQDSELTKTAH